MSDFDGLEHETPTIDLEALGELAFAAAHKVLFGRGGMGVAVEVGSWAGRTALVIADSGHTTFCVDHWLGNPGDRLGPLARKYGQSHIFRVFAKNMGDRFCTSVFPCCGLSRTWAAAWTRPIDFLFIDAGHDYMNCHADITGWGRHVRPSGTIVCHDYGEFEGVTRAVDELAPQRKLAGVTLAYWEVPS